MSNIKLLLFAAIASLIAGQLIRINLTQAGAVTITDIFAGAAVVTFAYHSLLKKVSINLPKSIFLPFALFIISATCSTALALNSFTSGQVLIALFFTVRLVTYIFLCFVVVNTIKKNEVQKWVKILLITGTAFAAIGLFQFMFFPNLTSLQAFGWDPHVYRLVSTTLDPNYTGLILTFFTSLAVSLYLFKKNKLYLFLAGLFVVAILLTFSRSSYLALLVAMLTIGSIKSPKTFFIVITIFILSFIFVPQIKDRIIGAFLVDETANARIISWHKAFAVFSKNPIFGVGYDTYRFAQIKYGFVPDDDLAGGHSGAGSDSSFLLVLATTGVVGFTFFTAMIVSLIFFLKKNLKNNYLSLAVFASFMALLFHTQFVNSFMFPQIMLIFWFLVGLSYVSNN